MSRAYNDSKMTFSYDAAFMSLTIEQPHFFECLSTTTACGIQPEHLQRDETKQNRLMRDTLSAGVGMHGLYALELVVYKQIVPEEDAAADLYMFTYPLTCVMLSHASNGHSTVMRVHNRKRMEVLVHGQRIGMTSTIAGTALQAFVTNLTQLSSPQFTLRRPHQSDKTKSLFFERTVILNTELIGSYGDPIQVRYPQILFLYGHHEHHRFLRQLIENAYVGFDIRFYCLCNNMFHSRKMISYFGVPIV